MTVVSSSANNSLSCSRSLRTVCKLDNKVWCEYRPRPSSFNTRSSTRSLMIAPRSSAGFKSGDEPGHSLLLKKSMPLSRSSSCVARALKHGTLSCRKQTSWTSSTLSSSWRKGRTLSVRIVLRKYLPVLRSYVSNL